MLAGQKRCGGDLACCRRDLEAVPAEADRVEQSRLLLAAGNDGQTIRRIAVERGPARYDRSTPRGWENVSGRAVVFVTLFIDGARLEAVQIDGAAVPAANEERSVCHLFQREFAADELHHRAEPFGNRHCPKPDRRLDPDRKILADEASDIGRPCAGRVHHVVA